jgi:hypothetical protein
MVWCIKLNRHFVLITHIYRIDELGALLSYVYLFTMYNMSRDKASIRIRTRKINDNIQI